MAEETARLVAVLEAQLRGFTKGMEQAQSIADRRFGAIEKRMRETETLFGGAFKNLGSLARTFGLSLSVGALVAFTENLIASTADLNNQAATLGISTDALQAYHAAALLAGAGAEAGDAAIQRFTRSINDAAEAPSPARKAFEELGLSAEDLAGGPEASLPKVAAALLAIADVSKRAGIEVALFGKSGQATEQLLQQWANPDLIKNMSALGFVIKKELIEKLEKLTIDWEIFWLKFKIGALDALSVLDRLDRRGTVAGNLNVDPRHVSNLPSQFHFTETNPIPKAAAPNVITPWADPEAQKRAEKDAHDALQAASDAANTMRAFNANFDKQIKSDIAKTADANVPAALLSLTTGGGTAVRDAIQQAQELRDTIKQITDEADQRIAEVGSEKNIAIIDQIRDSFNLTGAAGVRAFDNIGDAAKQLLQQILAMALQLAVIQPLMDSLFGKKGDPLGGVVGAITHSVLGFAGGGSPPVGRASIVGENGPELFVPRVAGTIVPNGGMGGGSQIYIDARGAQIGVADQIADAIKRAAPSIAGGAVNIVRGQLPSMMQESQARFL